MTHFDEALRRTLKNEGGLVDDPHDPGGLTQYGISQRAYPRIDISSLTLVDARNIYRRDYWQRAGCDLLQDKEIACKLFDLAVNIGPLRAVKMLQAAVNHLGAGLTVDGRLGPVTAAAVNRQRHPEALLMALRAEAARYYINLDQPRYLAGWLARLARA